MTRTALGTTYRRLIPVALEIMTTRLNKGLAVFGIEDLDAFGETVNKTKFLALIAPKAFKDAADRLGIDYKFVDANGYDTEVVVTENGLEVVCKVEDKMSLMESTDSFATGNNHSKVKDYLHFVMKLQNVGNIFTSAFAALIDVPALSEGSGWDDTVTKKGKNNNGFSSLKILTQDYDKIEVIYGDIRNAKKYIHSEYETLDA